MSPTYTSAIVAILATVLPKIGFEVGSEELTSLVSAIIVIVSGAIIMYRRFKYGGITLAGTVK